VTGPVDLREAMPGLQLANGFKGGAKGPDPDFAPGADAALADQEINDGADERQRCGEKEPGERHPCGGPLHDDADGDRDHDQHVRGNRHAGCSYLEAHACIPASARGNRLPKMGRPYPVKPRGDSGESAADSPAGARARFRLQVPARREVSGSTFLPVANPAGGANLKRTRSLCSAAAPGRRDNHGRSSMTGQWQYQVRIYLGDALAEIARRDPGNSAIKPLADILARHHATMKCQYGAFADYVAVAEKNGTENYPLYAWTKATIEDPAKKAKYTKSFTLYVEGNEVYPKEKADALEAELQPLVGDLVTRISKHDTNPANNPQPPARFRK
jgi:hypothetical protein